MSVDQQKKVFSPFTQGDNSMTRKFGGTGLGLGLAKKLAIAMGGNVELVESSEGIGTKFRVTILAKQSTVAAVVTSNIANTLLPVVNRFENLNVLIVEDSLDNQAIIQWMLESTGAKLSMVENGLEGVKRALSEKYDIILMDVQMPTMDGYQATQKLREGGYKKPIIAITAHATRQERDKCFSIGFDDFLTKPINKLALLHVIEHYVPKIKNNFVAETQSEHEQRTTI